MRLRHIFSRDGSDGYPLVVITSTTVEHERTMKPHLPRIRFLLMGLGALSLLVALWTGLVRLGWPLPLGYPTFPFVHGPLMVCGFLGTLIGIERAVALGQRWPYVAPLLSGVGAVALIAGVPAAV